MHVGSDIAAGASLPEGIPQSATSMVDLERSVANDAFNGATRIAGLVSTRNRPLAMSPARLTLHEGRRIDI